jgi:hypothetical protein
MIIFFNIFFIEKACKEIVGDEERRDPTPSTTGENDGDDQCHCYRRRLPHLSLFSGCESFFPFLYTI